MAQTVQLIARDDAFITETARLIDPLNLTTDSISKNQPTTSEYRRNPRYVISISKFRNGSRDLEMSEMSLPYSVPE